MVYGIDPVGAGFIKSLARPGGNVTGATYDAAPEIYGKNVTLLKEAMPRLTRVAFLWNPTLPGGAAYLEATRHAARRLALGLQPVAVRVPSELDEAFAAMVREHAQGIIVLNDPVLFPLRAQIARTAARRGVPVVGSWKEFATAGALLSYGPNAIDPWRRAAVYIDKILKGAKPGDLPVEQPTKFELVINLKTAKALGLTIPPSLLLRADQVIE
jgi:putative ABC transport system substrate-binding protein